MKQHFETRWIGWAGVSVQDVEGRSSLKEALSLKVRFLLKTSDCGCVDRLTTY